MARTKQSSQGLTTYRLETAWQMEYVYVVLIDGYMAGVYAEAEEAGRRARELMRELCGERQEDVSVVAIVLNNVYDFHGPGPHELRREDMPAVVVSSGAAQRGTATLVLRACAEGWEPLAVFDEMRWRGDAYYTWYLHGRVRYEVVEIL